MRMNDRFEMQAGYSFHHAEFSYTVRMYSLDYDESWMQGDGYSIGLAVVDLFNNIRAKDKTV